MSDNITLPREVVEDVLYALVSEQNHGGDDCYADSITALRTALAAEQPKPVRLHATTTGVLLGSAWLVWNTPKGANDEIMSQETANLLNRMFAENEALRRDAERWRHWRDSHGFATIDHEGGRCFVTLICDCDDPDQVRAKRFAGEDSFEWLDAFTDAAMEGKR